MGPIIRSFSVGIASLFVVAVLAIAASGCGSGGSGVDLPAVTGPPQTTVSSPTSSRAPASLPPEPPCRLLTREEVRAALGGGEVQSGPGSHSRFTGAAGFLLDIDMCSWSQQPAGTAPGRAIQISVHTTASQAEAVKEYQAFLDAAQRNTAPTIKPTPVSGVGTRAARIPLWLIAQRGSVVLAVTISLSGNQPPNPADLEQLAQTAARRLGW
jgi:hypothetical protein